MLVLPILVCLLVPVMMEGSLYIIPETPQQVSAGPTNPSVFSSDCDDGRLLMMIPETPQQVSAGPTNPSVFASACDDGRFLIYDPRDSTADKCWPYQS